MIQKLNIRHKLNLAAQTWCHSLRLGTAKPNINLTYLVISITQTKGLPWQQKPCTSVTLRMFAYRYQPSRPKHSLSYCANACRRNANNILKGLDNAFIHAIVQAIWSKKQHYQSLSQCLRLNCESGGLLRLT